MGHEELKQIGVNAYGHRHKLLKGIEKLYTGHSKYMYLSLIGFITFDEGLISEVLCFH